VVVVSIARCSTVHEAVVTEKASLKLCQTRFDALARCRQCCVVVH